MVYSSDFDEDLIGCVKRFGGRGRRIQSVMYFRLLGSMYDSAFEAFLSFKRTRHCDA